MTYPLVVICRMAARLAKDDALFCSTGQLLSLVPGKVGSCLRVTFYHQINSKVSLACHIGFGSYFPHPEIEVGDGVYIGAYSIIGMAKIGPNCTIGSQVNILSGKAQHNFREIGKPVQSQGGVFRAISVGENSWIGNGAIVMASLGRQNVVGAGAVVTKDSNDYEVLAGNPALAIETLKDFRINLVIAHAGN